MCESCCVQHSFPLWASEYPTMATQSKSESRRIATCNVIFEHGLRKKKQAFSVSGAHWVIWCWTESPQFWIVASLELWSTVLGGKESFTVPGKKTCEQIHRTSWVCVLISGGQDRLSCRRLHHNIPKDCLCARFSQDGGDFREHCNYLGLPQIDLQERR